MQSQNCNIHPDPNLDIRQALCDYRDTFLGQNGSHQQSSSSATKTGHTSQPSSHQDSPNGVHPQDAVPQLTAADRAADRALRVALANRLVAYRQQGDSTGSGASVTAEGILWSVELHRRLAREALILPLTPEYLQVGGMAIIEIDDPTGNGGTIIIPFFPILLRKKLLTPCSVCGTNKGFDPGLEPWKRATRGFGSRWIAEFLTFIQTYELPKCSHALDICRGCMAKYIQAKVDVLGRGAVNNIKCPSLGCQHKLTLKEIELFAPAETFRIYDENCSLRLLEQCPDFRWCLREGCGSGGFYTNGYLPLRSATDPPPSPCPLGCITCPTCMLVMCYFCQVPWHTGLTCEQYQAGCAAETQATAEWLEKNTRRCPGPGCGALVQIEGGCLHVHCERCRICFCRRCLGIEGQHLPRCRIGRICRMVARR